jgi:hypothetical protein
MHENCVCCTDSRIWVYLLWGEAYGVYVLNKNFQEMEIGVTTFL